MTTATERLVTGYGWTEAKMNHANALLAPIAGLVACAELQDTFGTGDPYGITLTFELDEVKRWNGCYVVRDGREQYDADELGDFRLELAAQLERAAAALRQAVAQTKG